MSIKAKQVAGVTTLVVLVVAALSAYHLAMIARLSFEDTASRGDMLAHAIFQRAKEVVGEGGTDPYAALRADRSIRSLLESSTAYFPNVTYAAIVNKDGAVVAHNSASLEGTSLPQQEDFSHVATAGAIDQFRAVYSDRTFEIRLPMLDGDREFGSIRIGVSILLVRDELRKALSAAAGVVVLALVAATLVAVALSQWMLRPIHVIQSGLSRLGRGELDVRLDLKEEEFRDLGSSFQAVSDQLSALGRSGSAGQSDDGPTGSAGDLESVMDNLEDAVALFSPRGELIFCNKAMSALHPRAMNALPGDSPVKQIVERTLAGRRSQGPISVSLSDAGARHSDSGFRIADPAARTADAGADTVVAADVTERLLVTHAIEDTGGRFLGAMLVARNIGYLNQVHSTLNYSRKLAALGRLMAGVAHEVKNPLNAMTIHLELLKNKLARQPVAAGAGRGPDSALPVPDFGKHVDIISKEIKRLDEVLNGFLKFTRPEELKLQPVHLASLISDIQTSIAPEAERRHITMKVECPDALPEINADPGMLSQALLNLALNACQAMPEGGTLRLGCHAASRRRVEIDIEDTGVGIEPENLGRIFDLYFTTKEKGSGIGLSMVYRIVQLHDGEVEVQSTPGHGTRFRLAFPQA